MPNRHNLHPVDDYPKLRRLRSTRIHEIKLPLNFFL